jgi:hypothetical protein
MVPLGKSASDVTTGCCQYPPALRVTYLSILALIGSRWGTPGLTPASILLESIRVGGHRWVKFKIDEGVILQFLRDAGEGGAPDHHHANAIAAHTEISAKRVAVVCQKSVEIHAQNFK